MYTDPNLEEKWRVQKALSKRASYRISELAKNAHLSVLDFSKEMKVDLKYSKRKGGFLTDKATG